MLVTHVVAALWLVLTLFLTLRPVGWVQTIAFWSFWTSIQAGVDLVQNLAMFAPMGWLANRAGWTVRRSVLVAVMISVLIEFTQQWVPGRTSTATDIVCNTLGAVLGWWMATPARRPRARMGAAFATLAVFMGLHVLNTAWPDLAERADGDGVWLQPVRHVCAPSASEQTVCATVRNSAERGNKHVVIIGTGGQTYAHVLSNASGRLMRRDDCVLIKFENTRGSWLRLRPPMIAACALADTADRTVELRVDPRLEHDAQGAWTPTRAGVWLWPVWPFEAYRPAVLRAVGALVFVVVASLFAGDVMWVFPAVYLVLLELVAFAAGMRTPEWWDLGWAALGWIVAVAVVALDARWRRHPI